MGAARRPALLLGATRRFPASGRKKFFGVDQIRGSIVAVAGHKFLQKKGLRNMVPPQEKPVLNSSPGRVPTNFGADCLRKRCESCLAEHPLEQFRRRYRDRDDRVNQCRSCHNLRERLRRAAIRHRLSRREMEKAMTQLKNCTAATRVPAFCAEMVQHLGGADGFLDAWKACIDRDLKRGGLPAFRHLAVLIKFMEYCEPEPVDYSSMSDEELHDAIRALSAQVPDYG